MKISRDHVNVQVERLQRMLFQIESIQGDISHANHHSNDAHALIDSNVQLILRMGMVCIEMILLGYTAEEVLEQ